MRIRRVDWKAPLLAVATLATACGHLPGTTSPRILAMQPVSAIVSGASETVLEGDADRPLYYSSSDTATTVTCRGVCTHTWIPFIKPIAPLIRSTFAGGGTLTWVRASDGCQAEYNGHPLYTYVNDLGPGEASGNDLDGTWFVVAPDLAPAAGWSASAPSSC